MRLRFRKNRKTRARELVVSLRRGDTTSSKQIRWLGSEPHKSYLPLVFESGRRSKAGQLRYDVSGLTSLKGFLRRARLSEEILTGMLVSLTEALVCCARSSHRYFSILFDPSYVFVGSTYELHFVFLPVVGVTDFAENTPQTLLSALSEAGCLRSCSPKAAELCHQLADFVLEQDGVFSLNALRRFVREACGVDVGTNGVVSMTESGGQGACCILQRVATGEFYRISGAATIRLGRGEGCDVRLQEKPGVSREHAFVRFHSGELLLWDAGSKNGTWYQGARLAPRQQIRLSQGDSFKLDDEVFVVREVLPTGSEPS